MPLPFVIGGAVLATVFGAKKGYDAYKDTKEASRLHEKAKDLYDETEPKLNNARKKAQDSFDSLGQLQADIVENELIKYAELIDKLDVKSNVELADIVGKETMGKLAEVKQSIVSLETTLGAVAGSAGAGALAGFGAFGGAGLLASASTGTAISALSGAAATNATLAWFGGGSLAAGGLGMAGGTLVLGSIVVAPVIAVAALVFAASAEKKKYDAEAYYDSVRALCEAMKGEALTHKEILVKSSGKLFILKQNRKEMQPLLSSVKNAMQRSGIKVSTWSKTEQTTLKTLMQLAEVVVTTINAPIMNDEDSLTKQLMNYNNECQALMKEIQKKWGDS